MGDREPLTEPGEHSLPGQRSFPDPLPAAASGFRFHHIGIPTQERRPGEHYLERIKVWASGFGSSEFGVEWLRFEPDSPIPALIQTVPHLAFEVDDLDDALKDRKVIFGPFVPFDGVRCAMVEENGAPVEMMQFERG
jgi:hypothetical protein